MVNREDARGNHGSSRIRARTSSIVGIAGGTLPISFFTIPYEVSVATTYWGSLPELQGVLALAQAGAISAHVQRFSLDEAPVAYERLAAGQIEGRAVIVPS